MKLTYEQLQEQLENAKREFRSADITMQNLEAKCEKLAAERDIVNADNSYLRDQVICWARECDRITFTHTNKVTDAHQTEAEKELANTTPPTNAFLAEVRAQARTDFIGRIEWIIRNECNPEKTETILSELLAFASQLRKGVRS